MQYVPQSLVLTGILPLQMLATIGANQLSCDRRRIDKVAKGCSNIRKVHTPLQHRIPALLRKDFFRLMLTLQGWPRSDAVHPLTSTLAGTKPF
ncbi:hypothetical protein DSM109990_03452 (plasmid) [Sulfitobacter dubius]|uniref:Secreted protein n=1 Tax=Sulfitobacter dubius TaxID=218673 RepID=A0ABY3ZUS3_9RHOB|nr:hypothetical protein DSM109990_03452 [Sulfitobacter dubius]